MPRTGQPRRRTRRVRHNAAAAAAAAASALLLPVLPSDLPTTQRVSIVLGYASLGFLLVTLAIGPRNVLQGRRNPVSSDLRRDLGIWCGLTGIAHVVFSLQHHFGGNVLKYFFPSGRITPRGVRFDVFGAGAYIGVAATLILVVLVAISNDLALRRLGRRWKTLQRANYVLGALTVVHTVLFWKAEDRAVRIAVVATAAVVAVVALQLLGIARVRRLRAAT